MRRSPVQDHPPHECAQVRRLRLAIIGFGRLGRACAGAISQAGDVELAGVVRHESATLPMPFARTPVAGHVRELGMVDAALVCVPATQTLGVACELLQGRVPVVECARVDDRAQARHHEALHVAAHRHRVPAVAGAGWDPGALPLVLRLFEVLIPRGDTVLTRHPGISLHHSAAIDAVPGVKEALTGELRDAQGKLRRYVYVELANGADGDELRRSIASDPLFAGEETEIFAVPDLTALEAAAGIVLQRRASMATEGEHPTLSLDARFEVWTFAARIMLDAARAIPQLGPGAHRYALGLSGTPAASTRA